MYFLKPNIKTHLIHEFKFSQIEEICEVFYQKPFKTLCIMNIVSVHINPFNPVSQDKKVV